MTESYAGASRPELERLSNLSDLEVADDSPDVRGWTVTSLDRETIGRVDDLIVDTDAMKARYLLVDMRTATAGSGNHHVLVPLDRARVDESDRHVRLDIAAGGIAALPRFAGNVERDYDENFRRTAPPAPAGGRSDSDVKKLTRSAEELRIGRRTVQTGEVKATKHVETEHVREPVTRMREDVRVERRPASGQAGAAEIRDDEVRVPITEEEVVVEKRPVVKEELVISKEQKPETVDVEADVRKERIDIDRTGEPTRSDRNRTR